MRITYLESDDLSLLGRQLGLLLLHLDPDPTKVFASSFPQGGGLLQGKTKSLEKTRNMNLF